MGAGVHRLERDRAARRAVYNTAEIADYQHFFAALPAGTKIDVDVDGSPAWANGGSSDLRTPPADDAAYAGFLNYLVNAFHGRVDAWEIWNEEDNSGWWTGTPAQYAGAAQGRLPGDQVGRSRTRRCSSAA